MRKLFPVALVVAAALGLAACGGFDPGTASVADLATHPEHADQTLAWCKDRANPSSYDGCQNLPVAQFMVDKKLTRWVAAPEPVQNKDAAFFKAALHDKDATGYQSAVNEKDWCYTQYMVKTRDIPGAMSILFGWDPDLRKVSTTCAAMWTARH